MWVRSRATTKGSATLEAVMLFPLVLIFLVILVLGITGLHQYVLGTMEMTSTIRKGSLHWVTEDDGLYWDTREVFRGSREAEDRIRRMRRKTDLYTRSGTMEIAYLLDHPPGGEVEVQATALRPLIQIGEFQYGLSLTLTSRRFLPAMNLRHQAFLQEDVLPSLTDQLGEFFPGESGEESTDINRDVYIVDDSDKAHDYLKVFHLHSDCRYVRNKNPIVRSREQALASGFRPCLICLRSQIADN